MTIKEFFEKYEVNLNSTTHVCETCALLDGAKCVGLFDGCPLPKECNFKKREK